MSEVQNAKLAAIDKILRDNPDMPPEFRTRLEALRAKFEEGEARRQERMNSAFADQAELKQQAAEMREQTRRRIEESNAFFAAWKEHRRRQAALIRRIAAKL